MSIKLKIKKLHPQAVVPSYAKPGDAGLDICTPEPVVINPQERFLVGTGLALEIPEGYVGLVWDKSGLASKRGLTNLAGVIDSGYRGEFKVLIYNSSNEVCHFKAGDQIAQLLIQPIESVEVIEADELSSTDRGEGGFGSTGR